jgi:hypothetical protein
MWIWLTRSRKFFRKNRILLRNESIEIIAGIGEIGVPEISIMSHGNNGVRCEACSSSSNKTNTGHYEKKEQHAIPRERASVDGERLGNDLNECERTGWNQFLITNYE